MEIKASVGKGKSRRMEDNDIGLRIASYVSKMGSRRRT